MEDIVVSLSTEIAIALAMGQGWTPTVDDTDVGLIEGTDEYPQKPNPVTYQEYIQVIAPEYLSNIVLEAGRKRVLDDLNSIAASVNAGVATGAYDSLILAGDIDGVRQAIKDTLE